MFDILLCCTRAAAQVEVRVRHSFSVEVDSKKRDFILKAHQLGEGAHLFDDVAVFDSPSDDHFCHVCKCKHQLPKSVDVLASGPSCKNISKMFQHRAKFTDGFLSFQQCVHCTVHHGNQNMQTS